MVKPGVYGVEDAIRGYLRIPTGFSLPLPYRETDPESTPGTTPKNVDNQFLIGMRHAFYPSEGSMNAYLAYTATSAGKPMDQLVFYPFPVKSHTHSPIAKRLKA